MKAQSLVYHTPVWMLTRMVRVVLAGCGGTGAEVLDGLVRTHHALKALGHEGLGVKVYDPDDVSATNVIRQRFWPSDVGQPKAVVSVHRFNVFAGLAWEAVQGELTPDDARSCDLLISCTDSGAFRAEMGDHWRDVRTDCLWLDTGNGARDGQVILGHLGQPVGDTNEIRLPNIYDLYGERLREGDREDRGPSCSAEEALAAQDLPVNRMVAQTALALIWEMLRYGQIKHHGAFIRLEDLSVRELAVDPKGWQIFGYAQGDTADSELGSEAAA